MVELICVDGNNLLHAMHAEAPIPHVGRETLVKIIERWAKPLAEQVLLVFDGPVPREGLAKQMESADITVRFSESRTADDVLVDQIYAAPNPDRVRIITSDNAIIKEARYRRCPCTSSSDFVRELFRDDSRKSPVEHENSVEPTDHAHTTTNEWLEEFGFDQDREEPFDGFDAMDDAHQ